MSREAMKQPEALRLADALDAEFVQGRISNSTGRESAVELRRLHEALETEQEPVAWLDAEMSQAYTIDELPDASGTGFLPLYTAPPKKQWVGLTTDEMKEIADRYHLKPPNIPVAFRAIEAKLKEKNHG